MLIHRWIWIFTFLIFYYDVLTITIRSTHSSNNKTTHEQLVIHHTLFSTLFFFSLNSFSFYCVEKLILFNVMPCHCVQMGQLSINWESIEYFTMVELRKRPLLFMLISLHFYIRDIIMIFSNFITILIECKETLTKLTYTIYLFYNRRFSNENYRVWYLQRKKTFL